MVSPNGSFLGVSLFWDTMKQSKRRSLLLTNTNKCRWSRGLAYRQCEQLYVFWHVLVVPRGPRKEIQSRCHLNFEAQLIGHSAVTSMGTCLHKFHKRPKEPDKFSRPIHETVAFRLRLQRRALSARLCLTPAM